MALKKDSDTPLTDAIEQSGAVLYTAKNEKDYSKTISDAKSGNVVSQYEVAQLLYMLGKMKNEKKAYSEAHYWYNMAANQGHERSVYMLGYLFDKGLGVKENLPNAFSYYKLSAERGFVQAQFKLSRMYLSGRGVTKDISLASYWAERAAKNDHPEAAELLMHIRASEAEPPKEEQ